MLGLFIYTILECLFFLQSQLHGHQSIGNRFPLAVPTAWIEKLQHTRPEIQVRGHMCFTHADTPLLETAACGR